VNCQNLPVARSPSVRNSLTAQLPGGAFAGVHQHCSDTCWHVMHAVLSLIRERGWGMLKHEQ